jgi:N-acetylglucosamine-6-sulfatase
MAAVLAILAGTACTSGERGQPDVGDRGAANADRSRPDLPADLVFFPPYLQRAGYETAMIGKWHMGGDTDDPQRGFDHWVSFKGQGSYLPERNGLNVDGRRVPQKGYLTDELTDYALEWLRARKGDRPFFLYLSHKGVHSDFVPPDRYKGRAKDAPFTPPRTMRPENVEGAPMWTRNQRNSWHGVEYPYHSDLDLVEYYKRYAETLLGVDDGVGRVLQYLKEKGLLDSTLVVYMGDNGFAFGEHGLIDKRTAYEESMRVPMIAHCPELFGGGGTRPGGRGEHRRRAHGPGGGRASASRSHGRPELPRAGGGPAGAVA